MSSNLTGCFSYRSRTHRLSTPMNEIGGRPLNPSTSSVLRTLMDSVPLQKSHSVPHPGEMVIDYLDFHGWSQSDLARRTGLTPKTISEICNGKVPITTSTALAFERVFQRPAHMW